MADYNGFDINTAATPKPWGPREEQAQKDIIDTLVGDIIGGAKDVSGHLHGKIYASDEIAALDASTSNSITINMQDDEATGLLVKNRNNDNIFAINSSTVTPISTFNSAVNISGAVGIGITSPDGKLHVQDGSVLVRKILSATEYVGLNINNEGSYTWGIGIDYDEGVAALQFQGGGLGGTSFMTIRNSTGNVGIGITSPDGKLHVQTATAGTITPSASADELIVENGGPCGISVLNRDADIGHLFFGCPTSNSWAQINADYTNAKLTFSNLLASGKIVFSNGPGPTDRVVIDSSGNMGIGVGALTPTFASGGGLHIDAGATTRLHLTSTFTGATSADGTDLSVGSDGHFYIINRENNDIRLWTNAAERMVVDNAGNVGIGTVSPGTIDATQITSTGRTFLNVHDSDNWSAMALSTGSAVADSSLMNMIQFGATNETSGHGIKSTIRVYADGTTAGQEGGNFQIWTKPDGSSTLVNRFTIDEAGKVGIGTDSPSALFDIDSNTLRLRTARTVTNSTDSGNAGDICWDADYIYVCIATDTWKRAAITTW